VSTNAAIVVGFPSTTNEPPTFHHREHAVALDPETGRERWRVTVVDHKPGEPMQMQGTMRLTSDATRVFAKTPGKLVALDAATGREMWAYTWTPATFLPGPPAPAKLAPLIAADGTHVALAFPNTVTVLDARTGAKAAELAVHGAATELIASKAGFVVALEDTPGTASIAAFDATAVRWTHPASHSVQRVRVDGDLAYALDGNGRIWSYALGDGTRPLGYATQTFDFAVVGGRVIAGGQKLVAFDPPRDVPPPLASFLRWMLEPVTCKPRALAWIDGDDRVVWERALPPRMRALGFGPCEELEASYYQRRPRVNARALYAALGVVETAGALVEADVTGILALDKRDGHVLLDLDAPADHALFFDDGEFELQGLADCKGPARSAHVVAQCSGKLVYFNGRTALVIAIDTLNVEARGKFDGTVKAVHGGRAEQSEATVGLGPYKLVLRGITYMR
jgi:outer membrane protein assembly factor BamB